MWPRVALSEEAKAAAGGGRAMKGAVPPRRALSFFSLQLLPCSAR
jgi:hypothetical protein